MQSVWCFQELLLVETFLKYLQYLRFDLGRFGDYRLEESSDATVLKLKLDFVMALGE